MFSKIFNSLGGRFSWPSIAKYGAMVAILMLLGLDVHAQSNGDYRTKQGGFWNSKDIWEKHNGSKFIDAPDYPGQNGVAGKVTIQNNHNVTLNVSPANSIGALEIATGKKSNSLTFQDSKVLIVVGTVSVVSNSNDIIKRIVLNAGQLACASINLTSSGNASTRALLEITSGTVSVIGNVTMNQTNPDRTTIAVTSTGIMNVGGEMTGGGFSAGSGTVNFNGTTPTQNIGSYSYHNLTLSGGGTKSLTASTTVANNLNLNGAVLELGNNDLTLSSGASNNLTGTFGPTNMVSTGGAGKLIVQGNNAAALQRVYPLGNDGVYNPMQLTAVGTLSATPASVGVRVESGNPMGTSATDLQKHWIVNTIGMDGTVVSANFQYQTDDVPATGNSANYVPAYQANSTGDFVRPSGSSAKGVNPFAINNLGNLNGTFTATGESKVWYALLSGDWDVATTWTLDPSGTLPMPMSGGIPAATDYVVVPNGKVVTVATGNKTNKGVLVQGTLDLGTTTGHNFTKIEGNGRIRLASGNFPAGDATHFVSKGAGEGTVVYCGNSFTVSNDRNFCHLEVAMNANQTVTLAANQNLNGNLSILSGTLQINNTLAISRTVNVMGNVELKIGAKCTVGTGNATHAFYAYGDIKNMGDIRFTNLTQPTYNNPTSTGSVTLYAMGLSNNVLNAGNITYLQRLVLDKGSDRSYRLTVNATDKAYFRLFGQNDNSVADKALYIKNGVLEIAGSTYIHSLTEGTDFEVPVTGGLWINSSSAIVNNTARDNNADGFTSVGVNTSNNSGAQSFTLNGLFKMTAGQFNTQSHGFVVWDGGDALVQIEGGTVITPGFRSAGGNTGKWTYNQSGGLVQLWGDINSDLLDNKKATFDMVGANNVFIMSGGEMEILDAVTTTTIITTFPFVATTHSAISIESGAGNFNVTGGTIRINRNSAGVGDFNITTTAPLYNLAIGGANASTVVLGSNLAVLNDLNIGSGHTFKASGQPLSIGKDMSAIGTFTHGNNTVTFNGTQPGTLTTGASKLVFNNVVLSKEVASLALTQAGASNVEIAGTLQIPSGKWNTADKVLSLKGNVTIADGEITNTTGYAEALTNAITVTGAVDAYVKLGNFRVNTVNNVVAFGSSAEVNNLEFVGSGSCKLNLGIHALRVNGTITNAGSTRYIYGSGLASNGGLELKVSTNGAYFFPVGSNKVSGTLKYTPATLTLSSVTGAGYVGVVPVDDDLATTAAAGGDLLGYYWKVKPSGFSTSPKVIGAFTYVTDDVIGTESNYVPGKVLDASPYTRSSIDNTAKVDDTYNIINYDVVHTLEKANYTAGANGRFTGTVRVFYSRDFQREAIWTDGNSWSFATNSALSKHHSSQPEAGDYPKAGDVAVIGFVPWDDVKVAERGMPHGMWVDNSTQTCAEVVFTQMTDASGNPVPRVYRSNFQFRPTLTITGSGQLNADYVKGEGMFWVRHSNPTWSNMDMGEFAANDSSYVVYEFNENVPQTLTNMPPLYPNVLLASESWGATDRTITLGGNMKTTGNLELLGDINLKLSNDNISVGRDLLFFEMGTSGGGAQLLYPNDVARSVNVGRDLLMRNDGAVIKIDSPGTTSGNHQLVVGRHIHIRTTVAASGMQLWTATNQDYIPLTLNSAQSMTYTFTNGSIPQLGRLIVDKGTSTATTASWNGDMDLRGTTSGGIKALELKNGLFVVNHADIALPLSTGGSVVADAFKIPSSSGLEIKAGNAKVSGGSFIALGGLLRTSGGTLDLQGGDHSIIYDASGNARIEFLSGNALIGGQIRRDATTEGGILKYTQGSTANVQVGISAASAIANRGTFEVLNPGSSFSLAAGARLKVMRGKAGNDVADVYFAPESLNQGAGSGFELGSGNAEEIDLYAAKPLQDLLVKDNSWVKLKSLPLAVEGNLEIGVGSTLTTDVLNLTLSGNFTNRGSYAKNGNTTLFKGTREQVVLGSMGFHYALKDGGMDLVFGDLDGSTTANRINVVNRLQINSGRILTNRHYLNVAGDLMGNGTILSDDGSLGVVFNNTGFPARQQELSGNLTIDVLKIENPLGVTVPTQGEAIAVQKKLVLANGVFDIGKNLLSISAAATIVDGAGGTSFSESNMIQTNISYSDAGVKRFIPAGASQIVFPVGAFGKFTPVSWDITANTNATGSIRIRPANEYHPTIQNLTTTTFDDTQNVLQYYWVVDGAGLSGFTGEAIFTAEAGDDPVTIAGKSTADYVAAQLNQSGQWLKFAEDVDTQSYLEDTQQVVFSFTNSNDNAIDGDYTAGILDAIPNNVQSFETITNGEWTQPSTWKDLSTGLTSTVVPRGAIVNIKHQVTLPVSANYQSAYRTTIASTGTLSLGTTFGHRLGTVSGTGKLSLSRGDLPSGVYDAFFSSVGGVLEYDGTTSFDILSHIPALNNLSIKGSGVKGFPNANVLLYGKLSIENGSVNHAYASKVLNVKGDVTISGTSTYNAGSSTLVLSGSKKQTVTGNLTSTSKLYNLMVSNIYGVDLKNAVDVDNKLMLSSGVISTKAAGAALTLLNPSPTDAVTGGGTSSYVEGFLRKQVTSGSYFDFPVGDKTRYGKAGVHNVSKTDYYQARYYNESAIGYGYDPATVSGVSNVSTNEYWQIAADAGGTAKVALRYDNLSGINPADVKIAAWISGAWKDACNGAILETAGSKILRTPNQQTLSNGIFTFAGKNTTPDYNWTGAAGTTDWFTPGNWASGKVPDASTNVVIDNTTKPAEIGSTVHPAECNNLTIETGCSLTLAPGSKLQVNGTTTVDGDLILQQDVTNPCSFIHEGAVTGNVGVKVTYPATNRNWYMGHAVKTNINAYNSTSFQVWRYGHSTTTESWIEEKDFAVSKPLAKPMEGFVVYKKADAGKTIDVTHTGELYQGDQSFTLDVDAKYRWNLVANPFPAYVDPRGIGAIDYSNIESTIWFRTVIGNFYQFTTYNVATNITTNTDPANPDNLIAPMQAFWVRATADGSFTIGKNARVHPSASNPKLKSSGTKVSDVLFLQLHNDVTSDETAVACRLEGSAFYTSIDSDKRLMGNSIPDVYTLKSSKPVTINIQPEEPDTAGIAVGFSVTSAANKSLHLLARNIDQFMPGMSVYLEDRTTGARIDLRSNPEYAFTSDPKTDNSRFVLKFEKISTGVDDDVVAEQKGERIRIFSQQDKAIVLVGSELLRQGNARVNIYNLAGSLMSTHEVSDTRAELTLPDAPGIYLVEAEAGGQVKREKVVK